MLTLLGFLGHELWLYLAGSLFVVGLWLLAAGLVFLVLTLVNASLALLRHP